MTKAEGQVVRSPQPEADAVADSWLPADCQRGLVSVVIPAYNRSAFLLEALESLRRQTYRPLEVLVVDDGSTDATAQMLSQWSERHELVPGLLLRTLRQDRAGACAARNRGLRASCGEFIQFLDSDDLLHPDRLRCVVDTFQATSCDYVFTGFEGFCGWCGEVIETHLPLSDGGIPLHQFARGEIWGNIAQFAIRRSIAPSVGPWTPGLSVCQDMDYLVRVLLASDDGVAIPRVLASVRRGGGPRISDTRATRAGYAGMLVGATPLSRGLASRGAPLDVRRAYARVLVRIALSLSLEDPDLASRFAGLARGLDARPAEIRDRIELLAYRSGQLGHRAYACVLPLVQRAKSALSTSRTAPRPHVCPGGQADVTFEQPERVVRTASELRGSL